MKMKELLKFEKDNMPDFQWKYEKFLFVFLAIFFGGAVLALIAGLIIGFVFGENAPWYIPLIVWGGALLGALITLVIKTKKLKAKLLCYHTEQLLRDFYELDYWEAKRNLFNRKKITEVGFISDPDDIFEVKIIPFEQVNILFYPHFFGGKLFIQFIVFDKIDWVFIDYLDNDFYNFLLHHSSFIKNEKLFHLFCEDKEKFTKALLKYNDASKIEKKLL